MRLIQSFNPRAFFDGEYPTPCIVEDENGDRIFLSEGTTPDALARTVTDAGCRIETEVVNGRPTRISRWPDRVQPVDVDSYLTYEQYLDRVDEDYDVNLSTFVHLHTHSDFSAFDGFSKVQEIVDRAVADNQPAIAITDHGTCASHPHLQAAAEKAGIAPIFGLEANFVDDRFRRPKEKTKAPKDMTPEELAEVKLDQKESRDYWHLILWAQTDEGLRNLWAMSTEANRDGFYFRPRMDWDTLEKYSKGVMCSTACLRGPVSTAILADDEELAYTRMARLQGIFGDRLYAELHTNSLKDQVKVNEHLIPLAERLGVPMVAVTDSHYSCPEHKDAHQVWIAAQTNKDLTEDSGVFEEDADYHIMSRTEVEAALSYLPQDVVLEAIANTVEVANRCNARIKGDPTPPVYSKGGIEADKAMLLNTCTANWESKVVGKPRPQQKYVDRFEREMKLLIDKKLCGYFDIVSRYCRWAKEEGILVGPGRGSGGASLVAYLCDITEVDPVDAELPFERFLTPGRTELPDFDIDFPSERLGDVLGFVQEEWGESSVVRIGTHIKLKNKGVVRDVARVLQTTNPTDFMDLDRISEIIEAAESNTAGLGLSWEDLWALHGDELDPYRRKYPRLFELADVMVGRLKSYGKHAAGVVIAAGVDLTGQIPLRRAKEEEDLVAEFDGDALAALGLVKFDFLGLRNLDTLQKCVDLIAARTGEKINLYEW